MSMLTTAYLLDKYGALLTVDNLAAEFHAAPKTIHNQISAGRFPIPTTIEQGKRVASASDVAAYLETVRQRAE